MDLVFSFANEGGSYFSLTLLSFLIRNEPLLNPARVYQISRRQLLVTLVRKEGECSQSLRSASCSPLIRKYWGGLHYSRLYVSGEKTLVTCIYCGFKITLFKEGLTKKRIEKQNKQRTEAKPGFQIASRWGDRNVWKPIFFI